MAALPVIVGPRDLVGPSSLYNDNGEIVHIAQFYVTSDNMANFARGFAIPNDCVINAMSIMGLLIDQMTTDICRIFSNNRGLYWEYQILPIFRYIFPGEWFSINITFSSFQNFCSYVLKPCHVCFCEYKIPGYSTSHVFLIGKNQNNELFYIDPQLPIPGSYCNLSTDPSCVQYLHPNMPGVEYSILCSNPEYPF